ncbi:MAG: AAA family ATPase [Nitrososphaeria archaeon]
MIESVELVNFLSHRITNIVLEDGVNVFVGSNGSGKSSVVDAITYALYGEHTRGRNNANIVFRGAPEGYTRVVFTVNGRKYIAERKFDRRGRLEGAALKDVELGILVTGERKQYGESVEEAIARILGLDYEKMKIVAIVQQGELDKIVNYTPKDFKDLINSVVGIDALGETSETMGKAIELFRGMVAEKYGYGIDSLQQLEKDIKNLKESKNNAETEAQKIRKELEPIQTEKEKAEEDLRKMSALKAKSDELRATMEQFKKHVMEKKAEFEKKRKDLEKDIPLAINYLKVISGGIEKILNDAVNELESLETELQETLKALETARSAANFAEKLKKEIDLKKSEKVKNERRVESLKASIKPLDRSLLVPEKDVENELEGIRTELGELEKEKAKLEGLLSNYKLIEKDGVCPVCGSPVRGEDVNDKLSHIDRELKVINDKINELRKKEKDVEKRLETIREAHKIEIENSGIENQISLLEENIKNLETSILEKEKELKEYEEIAKNLKALQEKSQFLREKKYKTESHVNDLRKKITEAKTWLSSKGVFSEADIKVMQEELLDIEKRLSGPENILDTEAAMLFKRIESLKKETEGYSEEKYNELEKKVNDLRTKADDMGSLVAANEAIAKRAEESLEKLEPALKELKRAAVYVEKFNKIREKIFHRDGELAKGLRSWAVKSISTFATDYIQLFSIGISEIKISEEESRVGIGCYTGSGFQDISALSGGEKVAVAVAIRFAIAKLLSSGNIDFIIMDEPTNYLDEERKKAFVDLVRSMRDAIRQIIIITHDKEIFENESVSAIFTFEKVNGESRVTKL